jgi:hypothetical protein
MLLVLNDLADEPRSRRQDVHQPDVQLVETPSYVA